jgi:hypothetical protein
MPEIVTATFLYTSITFLKYEIWTKGVLIVLIVNVVVTNMVYMSGR